MSASSRPEIADALRKAGLQVTAQRLAVYEAVKANPHAMADQISEYARAEIGSISKQAVYNVLNVMYEHRLIRRIQPAGSPARYEDRVDDHHHLICRKCGTLLDMECQDGEAPVLEVENDHGYEIDETEITFWGICPQCQTNE